MRKSFKSSIMLLLLALVLPVRAQQLAEEEKIAVLNSVIQHLETIYPFPDIAEKIIAGIQTQLTNGFYSEYNSSNEFATQVTNQLEELSHDKHLGLMYNPGLAKALSEESVSDGLKYKKEEAKTEVWNNYGFKELAILDGNIGYLNLSVFFATDYAGKTADIAMSFFSNCQALLIDLRQNGGGWDDMVNYLLAYFIDIQQPLLLKIGRTTTDSSYYSAVVPNYVPGKKLTDIPIYVLISPATASAAESFISNLRYYNKNVTLVGATTSGAENPVQHIAINENFVMQIPCWKMIYSNNPEVWEGTGIKPDIEVESDNAKTVAHVKALEKLMANTDDKMVLDKYQWALDGLMAGYDNIDLENIKKFAGSYDKIEIIFRDSKLYYRFEEQPVRLLAPISDNYFIVEGIEYFRIKFVYDKSRTVMQRIFTFGAVREITKNN